jgi:hypothetical protein
MIIIDNALSESVFNKLRDEVMSYRWPWYYGRRVNSSDGSDENAYLTGFTHYIYSHKDHQSPDYARFETAFLTAVDKTDHRVDEMMRMRFVMNTKSEQPFLNGAHIDYEREHNTALIYFNDSDGDTIIYNEKYNPLLREDSMIYGNKIKDKLTIKERITPKENRMVIFNGFHYHTGTLPVSTARRVVLNVNYTVKK